MQAIDAAAGLGSLTLMDSVPVPPADGKCSSWEGAKRPSPPLPRPAAIGAVKRIPAYHKEFQGKLPRSNSLVSLPSSVKTPRKPSNRATSGEVHPACTHEAQPAHSDLELRRATIACVHPANSRRA